MIKLHRQERKKKFEKRPIAMRTPHKIYCSSLPTNETKGKMYTIHFTVNVIRLCVYTAWSICLWFCFRIRKSQYMIMELFRNYFTMDVSTARAMPWLMLFISVWFAEYIRTYIRSVQRSNLDIHFDVFVNVHPRIKSKLRTHTIYI